jgi:hypothetical protein
LVTEGPTVPVPIRLDSPRALSQQSGPGDVCSVPCAQPVPLCPLLPPHQGRHWVSLLGRFLAWRFWDLALAHHGLK